MSAILSKTQYQVQLPGAAASTVSNGGTVAAFTTAAGSTSVTVTQPNHGYAVGTIMPLGIPVKVGGITLSGAYAVASVVDVNNVTITAASPATSSQTAAINNNLPVARYHHQRPERWSSPGNADRSRGIGASTAMGPC